MSLLPALIDFIPQSKQNCNMWDENVDPLWLLTPEEFLRVPDGLELVSIGNEVKVKGQDYIDQDTRFGMIAWGFRESQLLPARM
jgi:hypothetical protein